MNNRMLNTSEVGPESAFDVTDAGHESLCLRRLVREAIPLLANPGDYPDLEYRRVANALRCALEIDDASTQSHEGVSAINGDIEDRGDPSAPWR